MSDMTAQEALETLKHGCGLYCDGALYPKETQSVEVLRSVVEENAALKAEVERLQKGDEEILAKAKELSIEVDRAVEKARGYKVRAEKAEAALERERKSVDELSLHAQDLAADLAAARPLLDVVEKAPVHANILDEKIKFIDVDYLNIQIEEAALAYHAAKEKGCDPFDDLLSPEDRAKPSAGEDERWLERIMITDAKGIPCWRETFAIRDYFRSRLRGEK